MQDMDQKEIIPIVKNALREDIGNGDITTDLAIPQNMGAKAVLLAEEEGVLCGLAVAELVFRELDPRIEFRALSRDGEKIAPGQVLAEIRGNARALLSGERVALNFLQRLSGIATTTRKCAEIAGPYGVKILDTRKTSPGLRVLEKYAVRCGGGENHRMGLYDMILVKDNHIRLLGGLKSALKTIRKKTKGRIEVEVENMDQVKEALEFKPDIIMLDNMPLEDIWRAVKMIGKKARVEASGGINLSNLEGVAKTGVDFISLGCLTHSFKSLGIKMEMSRENP